MTRDASRDGSGAERPPPLPAVVDRRFVVKRELARGGMGVIFEAEHRTLGTRVAVKTLTADAKTWDTGRERLMREARALAQCRHSNVVEVMDAGTCDLHGPFVALEMIHGRSLDSVLVARHRLGVPAVLAIADQLCAALAHVHRMGVVHRDVKPGNVMVFPDAEGGIGTLRLVDFGIAVVPEVSDVVGRKLTGDHQVLGTPEYVAPEHYLGGAAPHTSTDLYALGVLLYECLMGDVPHPGSALNIAARVMAGALPASIRDARPDVPVALERTILRMLSRDVSQRYPTAEAVQHALEEARIAEGPSAASSDDTSRRAFVRVPYGAPVRFQTRAGSADGRTEDLSEGGVLVVTTAPCEDGERVVLKLPLPTSGKVVTLDATARWVKTQRGKKAIGLAFHEIAEPVLSEIRSYVTLMSRGNVTWAPSALPSVRPLARG